MFTAWADRYAKPADDYHIPLGEAARRACAEEVGRDGDALLAAVAAPDAPAWLREVPAVRVLRRVWMQNFCLVPAKAGDERGADGPGEGGLLVRWRTTAEGFPTLLLMIASPYDPEVHYAKKRSTTWIGYKVHLTETCDEDRPHLITHVETAPAPVVDRDALQLIHRALAAKHLLSGKHLVDAGYVDADQLVVSARDHGVELIGPVPKDNQWQAKTAREIKQPFADEYRRRAGIEGTLSLGTRTLHLRRSRYIGLAKTHLQHVLTAAAMNLGRISNWLASTPREQTRQSAFPSDGHSSRSLTTSPAVSKPGQLQLQNDLDRFHLVMDVIARVPGLGTKGAYLKQRMRNKLIEHKHYIDKHGEDLPDIRNWVWGGPA